MKDLRENFEHIKRALDEMLYYNPEELERKEDKYEERCKKRGKKKNI